MKFRKSMPIGVDTDRRKNTKKVSKIGHMRVSIPIEVRERIELKKGDYIEWEVDTVKKTLKGRLVR